MKRKQIWESENMGLFSDGTIGMSDGVGYVGTMEKDEVYELYKKLKKLFEKEEVL